VLCCSAESLGKEPSSVALDKTTKCCAVVLSPWGRSPVVLHWIRQPSAVTVSSKHKVANLHKEKGPRHSSGGPGSIAGSGQVEFVVDKVALGQVFSEYFGFPCQFSFHQLLHTHHHLLAGAGTIGQ
jgi:hypothetical protein